MHLIRVVDGQSPYYFSICSRRNDYFDIWNWHRIIYYPQSVGISRVDIFDIFAYREKSRCDCYTVGERVHDYFD